MGEPLRIRSLLLVALLASTALAWAQERAAERSRVSREMSDMRQRIARLPAAEVEAPLVLESPAVAVPDSTAAGESTPPRLRPQLDEVRRAPARLQAREILFVPLTEAEEATTRMAAVAQVRDPETAVGPGVGPAEVTPPPPVAVFEGAIRTLAREGTELTLKAVALSGLPLRYAADRRRFEGSIKVGVVQLGSGGAAHRLSEPILFEVTGPLVATPEVARVETTAPPYQTVALAGDSVDAAVEVTITSSVTPEGVTFTVPVQPALFVAVTPRRIQGWGLETADVVVQARALSAAGNRQVQLTADRGNLAPRELTLGANGTGAATIRSAATGQSTLSASGPAFDEATAAVEFLFPAWFLAAGALGGLAGGALRLGVPRRGSLGNAVAKLGLSVICGFLVLGLYLLGVNVVGFELPARAGELLVFVVAALGALGGVALLKPPEPKAD